MSGPVFLEGDRVTLHAIDEDDLDFLRDTILDPAVRRTLSVRMPLTEKQERDWYEERASSDTHIRVVACIEEAEDGETEEEAEEEAEFGYTRIGSLGIGPTDDPNGAGEIGITIAEPYWGNGYGTEAARLLTDHGFREHRFHRIYARVFDGNTASRRIWEKLGYTHEATHRDAAFIDGEYVDVLFFSVLCDEW